MFSIYKGVLLKKSGSYLDKAPEPGLTSDLGAGSDLSLGLSTNLSSNSNAGLEKLVKIIDEKGSISFADYMNFALYDKDHGYYTNNINAINTSGDFITAPEISQLFGWTLANQCADILVHLDKPSILEFGAGSAKLCVDIIKRLQILNVEIEHYYIVEISAKLKFNQQQYIKKELPDFYSKIIWLNTLDDIQINGVIIANEVLDAMPVKRFLKKDDKVYESFITYTNKKTAKENNSIIEEKPALLEEFKLATDKQLINLVNQKIKDDVAGYTSEVNFFIAPWIKRCYSTLLKGAAFIFDYGFGEGEYYHPDRCMGTLMCHFKHKSHTNPLINVGLQDITAHVDFTEVAIAGQSCGFDISGFTNQASFLLSNDLLGLTENIQDERELVIARQAIKKLTHPYEMGELFKVMALTKNFTMPLKGFELFDKRRSL